MDLVELAALNPDAIVSIEERRAIADLVADGRALEEAIEAWRSQALAQLAAIDDRLADLDLEPPVVRLVQGLISAADLTEVLVEVAAAAQGRQRTG